MHILYIYIYIGRLYWFSIFSTSLWCMQADETSYGTLLSALERVVPGREEELNRFNFSTMSRPDKVLLVLAILVSLTQLCSLSKSHFPPVTADFTWHLLTYILCDWPPLAQVSKRWCIAVRDTSTWLAAHDDFVTFQAATSGSTS